MSYQAVSEVLAGDGTIFTQDRWADVVEEALRYRSPVYSANLRWAESKPTARLIKQAGTLAAGALVNQPANRLKATLPSALRTARPETISPSRVRYPVATNWPACLPR